MSSFIKTCIHLKKRISLFRLLNERNHLNRGKISLKLQMKKGRKEGKMKGKDGGQTGKSDALNISKIRLLKIPAHYL